MKKVQNCIKNIPNVQVRNDSEDLEKDLKVVKG